MPVKDNREYREMITVVPKIEGRRIDCERYVEGYATTYTKPYTMGVIDGLEYKERFDRNAFVGVNLRDVICQRDHNGTVFARTANGTLVLDPNDPHGLFVAMNLDKSAEARNAYEEISNGLITKMSIGFIVDKDSYDRETHTRTILKVKKLFDVSIVTYPANADTNICARSWIDGVIDAENREAAERRKQIIRILCNT